MKSILKEIFEAKKAEVDEQKRKLPFDELRRAVAQLPPAHDFLASLNRHRPAIIAEIKRASPSKGDIFPELNPAEVAREYAQAGAAAISVLTDHHFKGSLEDLRTVRRAVTLPILRKDFIFDPYQVFEARAAGADCILLIVAMLTETQLQTLIATAADLGITALVEVHTLEEMQIAKRSGAKLIGINNRNLHTFATELVTTEGLLKSFSPGVPVVSESGIETAKDIVQVFSAGASAVLIGEGLLRDKRPGESLRALIEAFHRLSREVGRLAG